MQKFDGLRIVVTQEDLNAILENLAKSYLQTLFRHYTASKGKLLNGLEIKEDSFVIYYLLEN